MRRMTRQLGQFEHVPLRSIWPHEAADFTPWLAREENLSKLGEALGLELEVEAVERRVGPYSADIVARDPTDALIVIENQLEKTNHDHLGKCLTYASVLDASAVVWIASSFTDEHKKAFDWLNDKTGVDVGFYAVRLELWKIDQSKPAVRFNLVSYPADIVKLGQGPAPGKVSDTRQLQFEWWSVVRKTLVERRIIQNPRAAKPRYWYDVPMGRSGFHLSCTANIPEETISVRQYLRARRGGERALALLLESKDAIEKEIGSELEWDPNPSARDKTIRLARKANLNQKSSWPEHAVWLCDTIQKFRGAFSHRLKSLDLETPDSDDED